MKICFDTNIVLDIITKREGHRDVISILEQLDQHKHHIYITSLTVANTAYILRKLPREEMLKHISSLYTQFDILSLSGMEISNSLKTDFTDYEDCLQILCAESKGCDIIVTRDKKHFDSYTEIPVITPQEFVAALR